MTVSQATNVGDRVVVPGRGEGVLIGFERERNWPRGSHPTMFLLVELDSGGRCYAHPADVTTPGAVPS